MKNLASLKYFLLFPILLMFFVTKSQVIDSTIMVPASPVLPSDTITFYVYSSYPNSSCMGTSGFALGPNSVNGNSLHCQGTLTAICQAVDIIVVNPPHNLGNYTFTFTLWSGFGTPTCTPGFLPSDYDTLLYAVDTGFVNQPPSITSISSDTICENDSLGPLAFTVNDDDILSVIVFAKSDNQVLVPNSNISLFGTGTGRGILIVPDTSQFGDANITVVVEDSASLKDSTVFSVHVDSCAKPPPPPPPPPTGIKIVEGGNIEIFPNPSTGKVNIDFGHSVDKANLLLYNALGSEVRDWTVYNKKQVVLNLPDKKGLYFLKVNMGEYQKTFRLVNRE